MARIEHIYPEYIHRDGDTQPRAKIDQAVCDEYGERMKAGEKFPPIDVFFDGNDYWLADGFHRLQAYAMAVPAKPIECNLFEGSLQDAQWHSYSVNKTHGLRRTNDDKERAVTAALHHPNAAQLSNRQIAEHCGVSEITVRRYRDRKETTATMSQSSGQTGLTSKISKDRSAGRSRPRTGRDGRTINTAKIGHSQSRKAPRPRSVAEYCDAKQAGLNVRPPDSAVKLELPRNHVTNCAYDLLRYFTFEYLQDVFAEIVILNQQRQGKESKS